ncbi:hypothetical protein [Streptomyces sp. NPDC053720]|uniref:hypothetical protein n=1 Tax=Streptomyces sp. NPDC053720 TaxID=3154855 RepID=UPI0034163745
MNRSRIRRLGRSRELDLANTLQGARFGRSPEPIHDFTDQYGYDLTDWTGLPVLIRMRDLHTLGSFIRRADRDDSRATQELSFRIGTLQRSVSRTLWSASRSRLHRQTFDKK